LCLGSANNKIVEITKYYFDYAYHVAEQLDCLGIIVHHGLIPNTSYPAHWIKRATVFWQDFFNVHIGDIKIFMENQREQNAETLMAVIDACQSDRLFVNLDISHAHCNSNLPILDWIKQRNNRIKYVRIHQNNGLNDEHLGLNNGNIPIKDVLDALNIYPGSSMGLGM